jgi:ribonucleoside-diphosphate reductase alpha chain
VHPELVRRLEERGLWTQALADELALRGRVRGHDAIPHDLQQLFVTAHDLSPEVHVRMQAAFQKRVHAAVSKTVNFPIEAKPEHIAAVYKMAYDLGCKGVTVYRDRSQAEQVLSFGGAPKLSAVPARERCPECAGQLSGDRGCIACRECGWSKCG